MGKGKRREEWGAMGKRAMVVTGIVVLLLMLPTLAFACGGLVAPNGAVNLVRTTTLAAYHDGIEHYITAFEFNGLGGATFGSIVPLPGRPRSVKRAGDWTLQRLLQEVQPPVSEPTFADAIAVEASGITVVLETKIDALDITVVSGGADAVGRWAVEQGFTLSPDTPEVLDFYATRSPYFMAVRFDAKRARKLNQSAGDSTPIHIAIPTREPWVPLRILALGRNALEPVEADVFLLTERAPALLPAPVGAGEAAGLPVAKGLAVERSQPASGQLLTDLGSDKGMKWLPRSNMWLTYLQLRGRAGDIGYDLAIDPTGKGRPSWRAAGFPEGVAGPARNPLTGPRVDVVPSPVPVPVAGAVRVDRSGWLVAAVTLAVLVMVAVRRSVAPS